METGTRDEMILPPQVAERLLQAKDLAGAGGAEIVELHFHAFEYESMRALLESQKELIKLLIDRGKDRGGK